MTLMMVSSIARSRSSDPESQASQPQTGSIMTLISGRTTLMCSTGSVASC